MKTDELYKKIVELAKKSVDHIYYKVELSEATKDDLIELAYLVVEMDNSTTKDKET